MPKKIPGSINKPKHDQTAKKGKAEQINDQQGQEKMVRFKTTAGYVLLAVMFVVMALLLFLGPFQRGLFFPNDLLRAKAVIFGLLVLWGLFRLLKREGLKLNSPLDLCLVVIIFAYLISFFVAVHKRDALTEILRNASYLVVYLVAIDICRYFYLPWQKNLSQKNEEDTGRAVPPGLSITLNLLLASSVVLAIASLGAAAGNWDFIGAYDGARISSPLAYANAAAAYFMAAYFLAVGLVPLAGKWIRPVYLASSALMLLTVILTFSRGAWLLLPPLGLLMIISSAPGERVRAFLNLFATVLAAVPVAFVVDSIFQSGAPGRAWPMIAVAVLLAVLLGLLVEFYLSRDRKLRLILAGSGAALVIVFFAVALGRPALAPIRLERAAEEQAMMQTVQQVVGTVKAGEIYRLSFEVNAGQDLLPGSEEPEYVWGILVRGGVPGYRYVELLNYQGKETEGWQKKDFNFQTTHDINRLEVHLYNQYPGTSVTIRSVTLSTVGREQKLGFFYDRVLPKRFYDRVFSFGRDMNMDRRFELFRDSIKVIRDYPVFGTGGGGWAAIYHIYKEQPYYSREIHNHYLQVWVEAGIFGFLAFVGIWISFTAAFIRNCIRGRASPRVWQFWTSVFVPVAALGAHSFIDWNFSMAAVGIYLFVLLGAGRSMDRIRWFDRSGMEKKKPGYSSLLTGVVAVIAGIFLLVYSITLLNGLNATWRSQELLERNNLKQAIIEMEKAIRLDPLLAENYHNLSVITEEQLTRTGNQESLLRVIDLARKAHELEPYNALYSSRYGILLFNYVNVEEGLYYIDRVIILNRFFSSSYFQPAILRLQLAEFNLEAGNRRAAEQYLKEILAYELLMEENSADSRVLFFIFGRASQLLRDHAAAVRYYEAVPKADQFYDLSRQFLAEILGDD